jgi:hypothetical protein
VGERFAGPAACGRAGGRKQLTWWWGVGAGCAGALAGGLGFAGRVLLIAFLLFLLLLFLVLLLLLLPFLLLPSFLFLLLLPSHLLFLLLPSSLLPSALFPSS